MVSSTLSCSELDTGKDVVGVAAADWDVVLDTCEVGIGVVETLIVSPGIDIVGDDLVRGSCDACGSLGRLCLEARGDAIFEPVVSVFDEVVMAARKLAGKGTGDSFGGI